MTTLIIIVPLVLLTAAFALALARAARRADDMAYRARRGCEEEA